MLESESCCKRFLRLIVQLLRSMLMFGYLAIFPIVGFIVINPYYMNGDSYESKNYNEINHQSQTIISIYLVITLMLQIFGTYRGLVSHAKKQQSLISQNTYLPKKFHWNLGSTIAVVFLFYEVCEICIFFVLHNQKNI